MGILLGSNSDVVDAMNQAGISVRTFRAYRDDFNFSQLRSISAAAMAP